LHVFAKGDDGWCFGVNQVSHPLNRFLFSFFFLDLTFSPFTPAPLSNRLALSLYFSLSPYNLQSMIVDGVLALIYFLTPLINLAFLFDPSTLATIYFSFTCL
jgi:hypothetical protein